MRLSAPGEFRLRAPAALDAEPFTEHAIIQQRFDRCRIFNEPRSFRPDKLDSLRGGGRTRSGNRACSEPDASLPELRRG